MTPPCPPRPGTSGPPHHPARPPGLPEGVRLPLLRPPLLPSHPHPESDTKESGSWARAQGQSDQPDFPPSRHRAQDGEARRAGAGLRGWAREFSMNLFFFRLRSFASPAPQKSCHLPPPPPPALPSLLCCWQSHSVTSHPLPHRPPAPVDSGWSNMSGPRGSTSVQGTGCQGRGAKGLPPHPAGQRPCPLPASLMSQVQ